MKVPQWGGDSPPHWGKQLMRGTMSEMRYANTKILIVTCYLLLHGLERCCAFALPSFYLRS